MASPVAVVTGGSGDIGGLLVDQLLKNDYFVASLDQTPGLGRQAFSDRFQPYEVDITRKEAIESTVASVFAQWGRIDCLVNCAGIFRGQKLLELTEENWDQTMGVNLDGTFWSCQVVAPYLISSGRGGRIVNMSSDIAFKGSTFAAHYAASKAAVEGLSHALALELAPFKVNVNVVAPGIVRGSMSTAMVEEAEIKKKALSNPCGRIAVPEDVVEVILYLLGPESSFITGQIIHVNGGAVMI